MPLDPQAQAVIDQMTQLGIPDFSEVSPQQAREMFLAMRPDIEPTPVARVEDVKVPGPAGEVPVRLYAPEGAAPAALVYFHGGGWVFGDLESHDETCRALATQAGIQVIATDYRLAPETRYPGAADDCYAVTRWVAGNASQLGVDRARLAVGGDSAGGNLTAVVAQMARDRGGPALAFQLLVYPVTDADFQRASYVENAEGYFLTRRAMRWFWDHYVPDAARRAEPYAAPLRAADLSGLPPALVITAEYDPLRDEGEAYAQALEKAGVPVTCTRYPGMLHGFFGMAAALDRARDAQTEACAALRQALGV